MPCTISFPVHGIFMQEAGMRKNDLKELRKAASSDIFVIETMYTLYIDGENEIRYEEIRNPIQMEERELERHHDIIKQTIPTGIGKNVFPTPIRSQNEELLALIAKPEWETADFDAFRESFKQHVYGKGAFYAVIAKISYSVPSKASDGAELEDGDEMYDCIVCAACPAKLTPSALGFTGIVEGLSRQWVIGKASFGFLYPSFNERAADYNEVMIKSKEPENDEFIRLFFDIAEEDRPIGAKTQQRLLGELLERLDLGMDEVISVTETLAQESAADEKEVIEKVDLQYALSNANVRTDGLDEAYEEIVGNKELIVENTLPSKLKVQSDLCTITLPAEKGALLERRTIDGIEYILIPVDGAVIVNEAVTRR